MSRTALFFALLVAPILGCGGEDPATFSAEVQPAFTGSCVFAACHLGNSSAENMNLEVGVSYDMIVNVASAQAPSKMRVAPGDVAGSYLMDKIDGMGVTGDQMPPTAPLSEARREVIRSWIEAGAKNH